MGSPLFILLSITTMEIMYSISAKTCTPFFLLCRVLFWFNNGWFCPYSSGLLPQHWANHAIAPVLMKQPWKIWVSSLFSLPRMTMLPQQNPWKAKPCAYFPRHTVAMFSYTTRLPFHDDVIKWKQFPRYWPFVRGIHRSPVNPPHKDQWRGALRFSLICAWANSWANNGDAQPLSTKFL